MNYGRLLVTGGAGFIRSHLVDELIKDFEVSKPDNLLTGRLENKFHLGFEPRIHLKKDLSTLIPLGS